MRSRVQAIRGLHVGGDSPAVERNDAPAVDVVRVPGDVASGVRHRHSVGRRHPHLDRSVLCRDAARLQHDALRRRRDAQLPRRFLPCGHRLVCSRQEDWSVLSTAISTLH